LLLLHPLAALVASRFHRQHLGHSANAGTGEDQLGPFPLAPRTHTVADRSFAWIQLSDIVRALREEWEKQPAEDAYADIERLKVRVAALERLSEPQVEIVTQNPTDSTVVLGSAEEVDSG